MKTNAENIPTSTITMADMMAHTGPLYPEHLNAWELADLFNLLAKPVDMIQENNRVRQEDYFHTKYRSDSIGKKLDKRSVKIAQLALKIRTGADWRE